MNDAFPALALTACFLLGASGAPAAPAPQPETRNGKPETGNGKPGTDIYGDPLPPGAIARLGTVRFRHAVAHALAYAPDGATLASAGRDGTIRLWDAETGRERARLGDPDLPVNALAFFPDGRTLVSGGDDKVLRLWDPSTGTLRSALRGHTARILAVACSKDDRTIASAGDDETILLWDVVAGGDPRVLRGHVNWIPTLAFSPDGRTLASGGKDNSVRLWDVGEGKEIARLPRHDAWVARVLFSPDGRRLVSASEDCSIRVWDAETRREVATLAGHRSRVNALAFLPGGRTLVSGGADETLRFWDLEKGGEGEAVPTHNAILSLAGSPDGRTLVAGTRSGLRLWDVASRQPVDRVEGHTGPVSFLCPSADGRRLFSASFQDQSIRAWDVEASTGVRLQGEIGWIGQVPALAPDGRTMAWGTQRNQVVLWDVDAGRERARHDAGFPVQRVAFSPDGGRLWAVGTGLLGWTPGSGEAPGRVDLPPMRVSWCAFSPDRSLLARVGDDPAVEIWDTASGRNLARLPAARLGGLSLFEDRLAFSPDGTLLAMADGEHRLHLWEVATGAPLLHAAPDAPFNGIAFSPDGRILASVHAGGVILLREPDTLRGLQSLRGHDGRIRSLAFLPGRPVLASGGEDTTVLLWDIAPACRGLRETAEAPPGLDGPWDDLKGGDAAQAFRAVRALGDAGGRAVAFLRERLLPLPAPGVDAGPRVRQAIADLDHDDDQVRAAATDALRMMGSRIAPELRRALEESPSAEVRVRLQALLAESTADVSFPLPPGELLRRHRAIRALERAATPEAREALERLAAESPHLRERREAAAARLRAVGGHSVPDPP